MRYINNFRRRGVWAYENRQQQAQQGDYESRLVEIVAKFAGQCRETGQRIEAGERILWLPKSNVVYSSKSTHYERFQQRKRGAQEGDE